MVQMKVIRTPKDFTNQMVLCWIGSGHTTNYDPITILKETEFDITFVTSSGKKIKYSMDQYGFWSFKGKAKYNFLKDQEEANSNPDYILNIW